MLGLATAVLDLPVAGAIVAMGLALLLARLRRPAWEHPLLAAAVAGLAVAGWAAGRPGWWIAALAAIVAASAVWASLARVRRESAWADAQREEVATQLDRRISELFSLQELSYVLSESIQVERVVEQVARYAARFLQAEGALVVLREGEGDVLRVAAADGTLEPVVGRLTPLGAPAILTLSIERDRIEVAQGVAVPSVTLFEDVVVRAAAVAPLRAHGVTLGALAVVDRREGPFTTEDLWLLSTVATQASVVLANARLFEMVRRSKEEWETAFNALAEGLAVVDAAGALQRANRSLARLIDAESEDELVGRDLAELLFGEHEALVELVAEAGAGGRPAPLILRSDPTRRTLRLTASPLNEQDGEPASVVVLIEDVTEQRAIEAQLIQNEKMVTIGQLVSGVAHELNNPLTSIAGLAELLLERGPMIEAPREHLRVIHDQAERAGRIVRNLLTFARKGSPTDRERLDLNDVVRRTTLLSLYELKLRGIELETGLAREPIEVLGDRYELQQVLLNLITNAAQAVGDNPPERPRVIAVETRREGDQAALVVRDSGPGVPPTHVPHLFTPFFTTKGPGHGTGLGLSLSYGMVESHGGRLSYAPAPDGGAEFTVALPIVEAEPDGVAPLGETTPAPSIRGRRILLVDDDPAIQRFVSALFSAEGHSVEVTRGGENALRLVEDASYDLVIADATIAAGRDGLFVTALLARHPDWRERLIVATTAHGPRAEELFPDAALHSIGKPFDLRALRALATEIFGRIAA